MELCEEGSSCADMIVHLCLLDEDISEHMVTIKIWTSEAVFEVVGM